MEKEIIDGLTTMIPNTEILIVEDLTPKCIKVTYTLYLSSQFFQNLESMLKLVVSFTSFFWQLL